MQLFFSATLFLSAALLFLVQPMIGKMVLPLLGGTPAVWNTCMVFFQAALLAGYAYAHGLPSRMGMRRHAAFHVILLTVAFLVLPLAIGPRWIPPEHGSPFFWLLLLLVSVVGLPFFLLSTNAPLIQLWFGSTGRRSSRDPYFLYAASNLGSMLALASYPILFEPNLTVAEQTKVWTVGYGILVIGMFACALVVWRAPRPRRTKDTRERAEERGQTEDRRQAVADTPQRYASPANRSCTSPVDHSRFTTQHSPRIARLRWLALSFVPSSLMLSVTTYLTTDIAAIPLLWVIPLSLYLLTFTLAFARTRLIPHRLLVRISPLMVLALVIVLLTQATEPVWVLLPLHLLTFFIIALVCHGQLALERPGIEHLTEFYLWIAVGGVLGGLFNALLAPLIFPAVLEYPLILVLACILRPGFANADEPKAPGQQVKLRKQNKEPRQAVGAIVWNRVSGPDGRGSNSTQANGSEAADKPRTPNTENSRVDGLMCRALALDFVLPLVLGLLTVGLVLIVQSYSPGHGSWRVGAMFAAPAVVCYTFLERPLRFGLGIGALLLAGSIYIGEYGGKTIYRERSFFGVHRVVRFETDDGHEEHVLINGNTIHGRQNLDSAHRREPLTYYHRTGPAGQIFSTFSGPQAKKEVALVGLGAGALAAYGEPGQHFSFYEIDPAVLHIARDLGFFTFLRDSRAHIDYELGDARLSLKKATDHTFGMIVMDAFSSDSIPLHLLTREALQLYLRKLTSDGLLVFHLSNRYLELRPVLANLARDAGLICRARYDLNVSEEQKKQGKTPSIWLIMAHRSSDLGKLADAKDWTPIEVTRGQPVWTDDFSNLFSVFNWGREDD